MQENYEMVNKGFRLIRPCLARYIEQVFKRKFSDDWWNEILDALYHPYSLPPSGPDGELLGSLDIASCLKLFKNRWKQVFSESLALEYRSYVDELLTVRNKIAHIGDQDYPKDMTARALETMVLLSNGIDKDTMEELRAMLEDFRNASVRKTKIIIGKAKASTYVSPSSSLPCWRDIMEPHSDVAEGRYKTAEFAADLSEVANGRGSFEYLDPLEFFSRTYITNGMRGLMREALLRVSGKGGNPVVQLKTVFGGGKTHSMLALYHMFRGKVTADQISGMRDLLDGLGINELPEANVVVLDGNALNPAVSKKPSDLPGYSVSTFWGEMAHQLAVNAGHPEWYSMIKENDSKHTSPGKETLTQLFDRCGPCLILIDEVVAYARRLYKKDGLPGGTFEDFMPFIQQLTEAAKNSRNTFVVASLPESEKEVGDDAGKKALAQIEHHFSRVESVWQPVSANEGFEVVRRRLFVKCKDENAREQVCEAYSKLYRDNPSDFPVESREPGYKEKLIQCYPIHPEVFDLLYAKWATLEHFQRTRGVLRLMALIIYELWNAADPYPLIMPGSLPLNKANVKAELVKYLDDAWNTIIDNEVDGSNSAPAQLDKASFRDGSKQTARRLSRSIFIGSAPDTAAKATRGMEITGIRLGAINPGEGIADYNDTLNSLQNSLSYLYSSGARYWYDTRPTLQKTAKDRAEQRTDEEAEEEMERRIRRTVRKGGSFSKVHACPATSLDVPDEQTLGLVVLKVRDTNSGKAEGTNALATARNMLNTRGNAPRNYRNMLVFVAADAEQVKNLKPEVKRFLAWKSIQADRDALNLDMRQVREVEGKIAEFDKNVDMKLKAAYQWLLVPYAEEDDPNTVLWQSINLGDNPEDLAVKASRKLSQEERVVTNLAPSVLRMHLDELLWKDSDHISFSQLWDYFTRYCYLDRLSSRAVLEDAVIAGVKAEDQFALASGFSEDRYTGLRYNTSVSFLNSTDLVVKLVPALRQIASDAKKSSQQPPAETATQVSNPVPETQVDNPKREAVQKPKTRFTLTADIGYIRASKDFSQLINEVIAPLGKLPGADVHLTLEVTVDVPKGIGKAEERTVTENCKTLRLSDFLFEEGE